MLIAAIGREVVGLTEQNNAVSEAWKYKVGGHVPGSPTLGADGRIRVHSGDGKLHCITDTGEAVWPAANVGEPLGWAAPIVDEDQNTYVCGYNGGLLQVDPRGGVKKTPYFRTRQKFDSTGVYHRGVVYVGAEDAFVYAVNVEGNKGKNVWDHLRDRGKTEWFINSSPARARSGLIVAGRDEYLYAFDFDGEQQWRLQIRGQMLASPVLDTEGNIYVGVCLVKRGVADRGKLICVSPQSQRIEWEYDALGPVESTPVIGDDGVIYFGDNKGGVHAVTPDGRCVWRADTGSAVRSSGIIAGPNRVVFGRDDGTLVALVCSSTGHLDGGWPKYMGK